MNGVKGILLMAGCGERFGDPLPKQFHLLAGKKVYLWTLERFISSQLFEEIILVCSPEMVETVQNEVGPQIHVVAGGNSRQESSYQGLLACDPKTEIVVIHDAVRPFVSQKILEENVRGAMRHQAVDTCIACSDTLVHAPDGEKIEDIPQRCEYRRGQTPQSFSYPLILQAHEKAKRSNATDDCRLILDLGKEVYVVDGDEWNFKITTQMDLFIAEEKMKSFVTLGEKT